jgi:hypothetical protein
MRSSVTSFRRNNTGAQPFNAEETRQELMMPIILWLMGVPLVVVVLLMLTHVI